MKLLRILGLLVVAAFILTGCGSEPEDDDAWIDDIKNQPTFLEDEASIANFRCHDHGGIREFNVTENGSTAAICTDGVAVSLMGWEVENYAAEEAFIEKWGTGKNTIGTDY